MSIYSGFGQREQESKYNITLFDLVLTLSARVYGTLKNRTPDMLQENRAEYRFLLHLHKLHRKLAFMEDHKRLKPYFSQACDRLNDRIVKLIKPRTSQVGSHQDFDSSLFAPSNAGERPNRLDHSMEIKEEDDRHLPEISHTDLNDTNIQVKVTKKDPRVGKPSESFGQSPGVAYSTGGAKLSTEMGPHDASAARHFKERSPEISSAQREMLQQQHSQSSLHDSKLQFKNRNELVSACPPHDATLHRS